MKNEKGNYNTRVCSYCIVRKLKIWLWRLFSLYSYWILGYGALVAQPGRAKERLQVLCKTHNIEKRIKNREVKGLHGMKMLEKILLETF